MSNILLTLALSVLLCSCSIVELRHKPGHLPRVEVDLSDYCSVKLKHRRQKIECQYEW